jgi:hypothetical protein
MTTFLESVALYHQKSRYFVYFQDILRSYIPGYRPIVAEL